MTFQTNPGIATFIGPLPSVVNTSTKWIVHSPVSGPPVAGYSSPCLGGFYCGQGYPGDGDGSIATTQSYNQAVSATATMAASLALQVAYLSELDATLTGTATLAETAARFMELDATATMAATLTETSARFIELDATATETATLAEGLGFFSTISATATMAASLTFAINRLVEIDATATGTATLSELSARLVELDATASMAATLTELSARLIELDATATESASLLEGHYSTLSATATFAAALTTAFHAASSGGAPPDVLAFYCPDSLRTGVAAPISVEAIKTDGTSLAFLSAPTVRIYTIDTMSGSETDVVATTAMSQIGSTNLYQYSWTPPTQNVFQVLVAGTTADGAIVGQKAILCIPRFDPIALATKKILVSRF